MVSWLAWRRFTFIFSLPSLQISSGRDRTDVLTRYQKRQFLKSNSKRIQNKKKTPRSRTPSGGAGNLPQSQCFAGGIKLWMRRHRRGALSKCDGCSPGTVTNVMKWNTCSPLTRRQQGRSKWHAPRDEQRGTSRSRFKCGRGRGGCGGSEVGTEPSDGLCRGNTLEWRPYDSCTRRESVRRREGS